MRLPPFALAAPAAWVAALAPAAPPAAAALPLAAAVVAAGAATEPATEAAAAVPAAGAATEAAAAVPAAPAAPAALTVNWKHIQHLKIVEHATNSRRNNHPKIHVVRWVQWQVDGWQQS